MNYTCLIYGAFFFLMAFNWFIDARKSYNPPSFVDFVATFVPENDRQAYLPAGTMEKLDIEATEAAPSHLGSIALPQ